MRTMKAIVNTGPGQLAWQDRTMPVPTAGQVRIRTSACGICATDLEMIKGWDRTGFPAIPGHEWSGVVDVVGPGVEASLVGRPCVAENVLADGGEVGFEHAGGYGQFLLTEAHNIRTLPQGFPMQEAALIEPLAVCVRAMRRLGLTRSVATSTAGPECPVRSRPYPANGRAWACNAPRTGSSVAGPPPARRLRTAKPANAC